MATDKELVKRVQNGESEAYAELYRRYYRHIYTICVSMVKNPQDAEELAQEMFVHAYLKVGQLRDPARFFPWLKKMARNRGRNFIQRREANAIPLSLVGAKRSSANPDEEILRQELMQAVMEAIEALPVRDRQVVKARIDGLSHAEISRRFSISYRASLSRLYRVRKKLADRLKGLYSIFGLAGRLGHKWIISGGVAAVKIGTGARVTIGVIGVLVVGFTGFKIVTHQPDQEILSPRQATQETPAESPKTLKAIQQTADGKDIKTQIDSTTALSDSSEESVKEEEVEDFLAFLNQIDAPESSEETINSEDGTAESNPTPQQQERLEYAAYAATRLPVLVDEWKEIMSERGGLDSIYGEPYSDAKAKEFNRLQEKRKEIEHEFINLAFSYHAAHPEERAIFYPEGWIGQLGKQIGLVFGKRPD